MTKGVCIWDFLHGARGIYKLNFLIWQKYDFSSRKILQFFIIKTLNPVPHWHQCGSTTLFIFAVYFHTEKLKKWAINAKRTSKWTTQALSTVSWHSLTWGKVKVWTSGALFLVLYYFPSKFCSENIRIRFKISFDYLRKFEHLHTGSLTSLNLSVITGIS